MVIYYLVAVIAGFSSEQPLVGLLALLLGWITALSVLALIRPSLEFHYAVIRNSRGRPSPVTCLRRCVILTPRSSPPLTPELSMDLLV